EGDPANSAPAGARFFRRTFTLEWPADEATVDITAANAFTVWLNGVEVGKGDNPKRVYRLEVRKHMVVGRNVLAVQAQHKNAGPAGLLVRFAFVPNGRSQQVIVSDASWLATREA